MIRLFILLFFVLNLTVLCQAQMTYFQESNYIKRGRGVSVNAIKKQKIEIYDNYIRRNPPSSDKTKSWTYGQRAYIIGMINQYEIINKTNKGDSVLKLVKTEIDKGIAICKPCKVSYKLERLKLLKMWNQNESDYYKNEFNELLKMGYKPKKKGISFGPTLMQSQDTWIGAEIGFLSILKPKYVAQEINPTTNIMEVLSKQRRFKMEWLVYSRAYSLQNAFHEWAISIFQISDPIFLNFTKIGMRTISLGEGLQRERLRNIFYRPEIGVGYKNFILSYSYHYQNYSEKFKNFDQPHGITIRYLPILKK